MKQYLAERTLYHGTLIDHKDSILSLGLIPSVGDFVDWAYGNEEDMEMPELVFMADKKQLQSAFNAITHHVANKLDKSPYDVTSNDIRSHGMLAVIKNVDDIDGMPHRPSHTPSSWEEHPYSVEPGDYYSEDLVYVDFVLTGQKLVDFMKQYGGIAQTTKTNVVGNLIRQHGKGNVDTILKYVDALTDRQLRDLEAKTKNMANENLAEFVHFILKEASADAWQDFEQSAYERYANIKTDSNEKYFHRTMKVGGILKRIFAKHMDKQFIRSLTTIHWSYSTRDVLRMLTNMSRRDEISCRAYLPQSTIIV
jgi:hypothetical protein